MTDISKCNGENCKIKEKCWRFKAPSSNWQSYIVGPVSKDGKTCKMFWDIRGN